MKLSNFLKPHVEFAQSLQAMDDDELDNFIGMCEMQIEHLIDKQKHVWAELGRRQNAFGNSLESDENGSLTGLGKESEDIRKQILDIRSKINVAMTVRKRRNEAK